MTGLEKGVGQEAAAMRGLTMLTKVLESGHSSVWSQTVVHGDESPFRELVGIIPTDFFLQSAVGRPSKWDFWLSPGKISTIGSCERP